MPVPKAPQSPMHDAAEGPIGVRRRLWEALAVAGISLLVHAIFLVVCALILFPVEIQERISTILATLEPATPAVPTFETVLLPETLDDHDTDSNAQASGERVTETLSVPFAAEPQFEPSLDPELDVPAPPLRLTDATSGRNEAAKQALLKRFGGNAASEAAVNNGLKWLASIQQPDGSWSFREIGGAPNPGTIHAGTEMGATACALLCFLGAGHTHIKAGPYKEVVQRGFDYLVRGGKIGPSGGDYRGDLPARSHAGMYIQGLVAIALAEGYAMTQDRRLRRPAIAAARFIVAAQDPQRGGWRYQPGSDSDTSVVGWQLMALKSAQAAGYRVPPPTFANVSRFLDSVAADGGSKYGYTGPQTNRPSTTAIGLLCQMYLGWGRDHPALQTGVRHLAALGPDFNDLYYIYYATQVLHHWGGEEWETWNKATRDGLVSRQVKSGRHAGSWNPGGTHSGRSGGRLFDTCLAIMTLEVYYRHLPLYERENLQIEF
jgi:hypothetical protein